MISNHVGFFWRWNMWEVIPIRSYRPVQQHLHQVVEPVGENDTCESIIFQYKLVVYRRFLMLLHDVKYLFSLCEMPVTFRDREGYSI